MILHLKNKNLLAFRKMVAQCKEKGGIPSHISVSDKEAEEILDELVACRNSDDVQKNISITGNDNLLSLNFAGHTADVIKQWKNNEMSITYHDVPLVVRDEEEKTENG